MKELFFVTSNINKFNEVKQIMEKEDIKLLQTNAKIIEQ